MPITLTEYAVRIKATQKYLPRSQRRDGRGGSHLEPVDFSDRSTWPKRYERDMQIRSYTTEQAAKNLLNSWLQGKFSSDGEGGGYLIDNTSRENMRPYMEIVQITIVLP